MNARELTKYTPLAKRPGGHVDPDALRERLKVIAEDFPSVTTDAHQWLADEERFIRIMRDMIKAALTPPGTMGPRPNPTPDEARAEWACLVTAATGTPPETPTQYPRRAPREAQRPWDVVFREHDLTTWQRR